MKRARGTERRHRVNPAAPRLEPCAPPSPPRKMAEAEREVWARLAGEVMLLGVYDKGSATAFRVLHRLVCAVELGDPSDPPTAQARAAQACLSALTQWGMTPASREKVSARPAEPAETDPLAEFRSPLRAV